MRAIRLAAGALAIASLAFAPGAFACKFQVEGSLGLPFGVLDPSRAEPRAVILQGILRVGGDCRNVLLTLSADNGLHANSGTRRLWNGSDFIPYILSLPPPITGSGNWVRPLIRAHILANTYENASAGDYHDALVISITP